MRVQQARDILSRIAKLAGTIIDRTDEMIRQTREQDETPVTILK